MSWIGFVYSALLGHTASISDAKGQDIEARVGKVAEDGGTNMFPSPPPSTLTGVTPSSRRLFAAPDDEDEPQWVREEAPQWMSHPIGNGRREPSPTPEPHGGAVLRADGQ